MRQIKFLKSTALVMAITLLASCKDYLDINVSPNNVLDSPLELILPAATATVGFISGSDMHRYTALISQQFSGQGQGIATQTQEYERYNIQGSDLNNVWNILYAGALADLELIIRKAEAEGSPHYAGVAKVLKAYLFQIIVDAWGDAPYSEAFGFAQNTKPKFDNGQAIYADLERLLDEAITNLNAATSTKSPDANASTIFPAPFSTSKARWIKTANTLKLRLLLHQRKLPGVMDKINAFLATNPSFIDANADNFQMAFLNEARRQNPIHQFEVDRVNQFFPNKTLVDLMNNTSDPRRRFYFTPFPFTRENPQYKGAAGGDPPALTYSRMHVYLRGDTTNTTPVTPMANGAISPTAYTYNGTAPVRMITAAEYNFMRAELALFGAPGDAETFFRNGIRLSMQAANVPTAEIDAYLAANGSLTGSNDEKLKKIIEEKFVALYGVVMEPWNDWRRTGYPVISAPSNALYPQPLRSLFYPQSEIDLNPNAPRQKEPNTLSQPFVFWDK